MQNTFLSYAVLRIIFICNVIIFNPIFVGNLHAAEMARPNGAVVITIAGKIANWNFKPETSYQTSFFKHHNIEVKQGYQFDLAMLTELEQKAIKLKLPNGEKELELSGPLLKDVLGKTGAESGAVRIMALDGYAVDLSPQDLASKDWIVALKMDGKPLALGGRGPLWIVHTPAKAIDASEEEEKSWVWSAFYIEVGVQQ